ncbi:Calpain-type cysteine protease DEK1 [Capsicum baccatum]|uniref:Calpain-type cysteine protease DEK1 n=1 Tax=Capsicum baccatum TaxID=33114 RepID=A0A2G2WVJ0_CAPBA|nr:Calpain-type cysteine protease DEK1 [Capsicum baccatum]
MRRKFMIRKKNNNNTYFHTDVPHGGPAFMPAGTDTSGRTPPHGSGKKKFIDLSKSLHGNSKKVHPKKSSRDSSRDLSVPVLIRTIRRLTKEKVQMDSEVSSMLQNQVIERASAKEEAIILQAELDSRTRRLETEKNELISILEKELDRRSSDWSLKLEKYQTEQHRLWERARELVEKNADLAATVRGNDILKCEVRNTLHALSYATPKLKYLELQVLKKVENINQLTNDLQECMKELGVVKAILPKVFQERDFIWEEVKSYCEMNLLLNYEINMLKRKCIKIQFLTAVHQNSTCGAAENVGTAAKPNGIMHEPSTVIRLREGFRRKDQNSSASSSEGCGSSVKRSSSADAGHLGNATVPCTGDGSTWKNIEGFNSDKSIDSGRQSLAPRSSSYRSVVQEPEVGSSYVERNLEHNSSLVVCSSSGLESQGGDSSTSTSANQHILDLNLALAFQEKLSDPRITSMLKQKGRHIDRELANLLQDRGLDPNFAVILKENGLDPMNLALLQRSSLDADREHRDSNPSVTNSNDVEDVLPNHILFSEELRLQGLGKWLQRCRVMLHHVAGTPERAWLLFSLIFILETVIVAIFRPKTIKLLNATHQ